MRSVLLPRCIQLAQRDRASSWREVILVLKHMTREEADAMKQRRLEKRRRQRAERRAVRTAARDDRSVQRAQQYQLRRQKELLTGSSSCAGPWRKKKP